MMLPREHGAYGQLLLPMATAMALGRPSLAAVAVAAGAVAAFVAHEPLMILLGRRGAHVRRARQHQAIAWLLATGVAALALEVTGVVLLPAASRWTMVVPLGAAALAAVWIARGAGRSTSGEIVAAAALASVAFPVAVASSASIALGLTCASVFAAGFAAATVSVRAVIGKARGGGAPERRIAIATGVLLLAAIAALSSSPAIAIAGVWAAAPVPAVALALALVVPPPRYLRPIGWTLVAASVLTGIILVSTVR